LELIEPIFIALHVHCKLITPAFLKPSCLSPETPVYLSGHRNVPLFVGKVPVTSSPAQMAFAVHCSLLPNCTMNSPMRGTREMPLRLAKYKPGKEKVSIHQSCANCFSCAEYSTFDRETIAHEPTLNELLQGCLQTGESVLWDEFVRRSEPMITAVVRKKLNGLKLCFGLQQDLVQDTYLKLCTDNFRALRQFTPQHAYALFGFLKIVASNTVHDYFRSSCAIKRGNAVEEVSLVDNARTPFCDISERVERKILMREIEACLAMAISGPNLIRDRTIFRLHYRYGMSAKEISKIDAIGLSVKGVESTLFRIIQLLRQKINERSTSGELQDN
jgi:RNA polymerase sigma-70 factor (ECF subfamily)